LLEAVHWLDIDLISRELLVLGKVKNRATAIPARIKTPSTIKRNDRLFFSDFLS